MIDIDSFNLVATKTDKGNWRITSTSPEIKDLLVVSNSLHAALSEVSNAISGLRIEHANQPVAVRVCKEQSGDRCRYPSCACMS